MTPDEKASLEILIARNAESVKAEIRKIAEAKKEGREDEKVDTIKNGLKMGFTAEQCALLASVSVGFVLSVQQKFSVN